LWSAATPDYFDFQRFSSGDFVGALAETLTAETVTRVLYPDDSTSEGRGLRFLQQYFLVACTLADAVRLAVLALEQAGMTGVRVVTALGTALLGTALARAELDRGTPHARLEDALLRHLRAARPYGLRDWREEAARFARWAGGWTRADLGRALRLTLAADRALKGTGTSDERGIIVQLVVEFAVPAREAA